MVSSFTESRCAESAVAATAAAAAPTSSWPRLWCWLRGAAARSGETRAGVAALTIREPSGDGLSLSLASLFGRASYDETFAVANGLLEGFPEVNHASPTSPDLLGMYGLRAQEQTTSPASMLQIQHFVLILWTRLTKLTTRKDNRIAYREFLQGASITEACDDNDNIFWLSTNSLSLFTKPICLEVREKGYERLKEKLAKSQRELKLKDEECERLSKELEKLTATLFKEAHKMVRKATVKQAKAEQQLKEAQGKIEILAGCAHNRQNLSFLGQNLSERYLSMFNIIKNGFGGCGNNTLSIKAVGLQPIGFVKASIVECGGQKKKKVLSLAEHPGPSTWAGFARRRSRKGPWHQPPSGTQDPGFPCSPSYVRKLIRKDVQGPSSAPLPSPSHCGTQSPVLQPRSHCRHSHTLTAPAPLTPADSAE
ncbi:LOW QUALITY PROTEIN: hypothetical protein QTO34_016933 [Cnephaeus nilssonii]|uniref:GDP/GTP exchange factor Sec2 N-terminal domain-containing protein n=1 Tax=Cnephaeus nilssonii TaxID=3371016 RepID=A0AA40I360_CNENI|nr:LOW QUALITY PROTEIN: hypothetical protein QTO34_016933 [Eptesicus nilssonii]